MISPPKAQEIDHRTIKLLIGFIALTLAPLTSLFSGETITSISASYYEGGWAQTIFLGFLFAIAAFLFAYNGLSLREMILSKIAAIAALGVALFPCKCECHVEVIPYVHAISAAIMFFILAWFCLIFFKRAISKEYKEAKRRANLYVVCGLLIIASILILALDHFLNNKISEVIPRLTFYGELTGLVAFGASWLTSSKVIPVLANAEERLTFFNSQQ